MSVKKRDVISKLRHMRWAVEVGKLSRCFRHNCHTATHTNHSMCCQVITLNFRVFNLESDYDNVILYDGIDTSAPLIASLSGSPISSSAYTSTQRYMFLRFTSDSSVTYVGFYATYNSSGELFV